MAATPNVRRVVVSRSRPSAAPVQTASPSTPLGRSLSSIYGSPGSFRTDEENALVFEFGARHMRAGFAGEPAPRCTVAYTPEQNVRVGKFDRYSPGYVRRARKRKRGQDWDEGHVLCKADLSDVHLEHVHDKLERLIRTTEQKYLMLDNRAKRIALAVPSMLPRPLLSTVLSTLFTSLQAISVTLLPSSVMTTVAAGLRSALVVDMGWEETHVYSVCEYREIRSNSSVRAGRMLSRGMKKLLNRKIKEQNASQRVGSVSFEEVDDIVTRACWCRPHDLVDKHLDRFAKTTKIPLNQSNLPSHLELTLQELSQPVESTFFTITDKGTSDDTLADDHNLAIPQLIYNALLHLPPDTRQTSMSRLVLTGGCSRILGLKDRILADLSGIIDRRGWSSVKNRGSVSQDSMQISAVVEKPHLPTVETQLANEAPTGDVLSQPPDYPSDKLLATLTPDEATYLRALRTRRLKEAHPTRRGPISVRTIGTGMTLAPPKQSTQETDQKIQTPESQRTSQPLKPAAWQPQEADPVLEKIQAIAKQELLLNSNPRSPREATSPLRSPLSLDIGMGSIDAQTGMLPPHNGENPTSPTSTHDVDVAGQGRQRHGLRAVMTLGAWQGASLLANLRIKGVVEIEREKFLRDGYVG